MELRSLRYFVALAERLSFTRAAAQMNVTQSTLSHQIRQLEMELDTALVERVGRRVLLTHDGEVFLVHARRSLAEIEAGRMSLKAPASARTVRVRIGTTATLCEIFVPQCVATHLQRSADARITLDVLSPQELRSALLEERIDLGVAHPPMEIDGLWQVPLFEERMRILVRRGHPLAQRRRLQLADLHGHAIALPDERYPLRAELEAHFRAAGVEPVVAVDRAGSLSTLRVLLASVNIAAVMPESACPSDESIHAIPVEGPCPVRTVTLYLKRDRTPSPAVRSLIDIIKCAGRVRRPRPARR